MAKSNLIFICTCLMVVQIVIASLDDEIDWTTMHDEFKKLAAPIRKKCLAESGTTLELVEGLELGEFPDDNQLACYFKCALEKGGLMKKDGKINVKMMVKMLPPEYKKLGSELLNSCSDIKGKDKCDIAYKFANCLYLENPVAFMAP